MRESKRVREKKGRRSCCEERVKRGSGDAYITKDCQTRSSNTLNEVGACLDTAAPFRRPIQNNRRETIIKISESVNTDDV